MQAVAQCQVQGHADRHATACVAALPLRVSLGGFTPCSSRTLSNHSSAASSAHGAPVRLRSTCYDLTINRHTVSQETQKMLTKRRARPAAPAQMAPSRRDGQHAVRVGLDGRDRYCGLWCYGVISCLCTTHSLLLHWLTYRYNLPAYRCLLAGTGALASMHLTNMKPCRQCT